nr:DUF4981 domain-containing protein [Cytophagales bacterium]
YYLTLSFRLKQNAPWAEAGHEVAWHQFMLNVPRVAATAPAVKPEPLKVLQFPSRIEVVGSDFSINFDKSVGALAAARYKGQEIIKGQLRPHFWRVPTDNDEGGGVPFSFAARWRAVGLDKAAATAESINVEQLNPTTVRVTANNRVNAKEKLLFRQKTVYTIYGSGDVSVETTYTPVGQVPPLARVGMQLSMPGSYSQMQWYGRGPHESYWDRKEGARVGRYAGKVTDQYFNYLMAQENGNKTDVRWVAVTNPEGVGLLAVGEPLLNVNVRDYTDDALLRAKTTQELTHGSVTVVNLDYQQMGLGGDDSWSPRTHAEYQLPANTYTYRFRLRFIDTAKTTPDEAARTPLLPVGK